MRTLKLFVNDGQLSYTNVNGNVSLVIQVYNEGDCDTFEWPFNTEHRSQETQEAGVVSAIYDDREQGYVVSEVDRVELPNGQILLL